MLYFINHSNPAAILHLVHCSMKPLQEGQNPRDVRVMSFSVVISAAYGGHGGVMGMMTVWMGVTRKFIAAVSNLLSHIHADMHAHMQAHTHAHVLAQ